MFTNIGDFTNIEFTGGQVLIVDDEELNRGLILSCLASFDVEIHEAKNGLEAINMAQKYLPDVILMDIKMPFKDGFEACQDLMAIENTKHIPVLAFTASYSLGDENKKRMSIFKGIVYKPVSVDELFEELAKYLPHIIR